MKKILLIFIFNFSLLTFFGCGYKPSSTYQNRIMGNNIRAVVDISIKNPKESITLKDALNDAVYTIFNADLNNKTPDTTIYLTLSSNSLSPLDYDANGYPILYRSKVTLKAKIIDKHKKIRNYTVSGNYDFSVEANSILNEQVKLTAFKRASINALNELYAQITKDGVKYDN